MRSHLLRIMGPAGGREAFDAAIAAGTDEIYMGLAGYGARRFAANFSTEEYCRALDDAHRFSIAVNLTLNTVMSDAEIDGVEADIRQLYNAGLDGIIVQDWGVAAWIAENFPRLPIHGSTQMALTNGVEAAWGEKIGLTRIVLPRELSLDEIASIRQKTDAELEVFTSGALCLGCSGKCYLSSFVGGRSGNRGACAQPCRQIYRQISQEIDSSRPEQGYLFSLKDQLHCEEDLRQMLKIGVDVLKIEGRMKSPLYVYEAVRYYRRLIDKIKGIDSETIRKTYFIKEDAAKNSPQTSAAPGAANSAKSSSASVSSVNLQKIFNRGYADGFLHSPDPDLLNPSFASHYGYPIGKIERGKITLTEPLTLGDGIVYLDKDYRKLGGTNVSDIRILPQNRQRFPIKAKEAAPGDQILLEVPPPTGACYLYKNFDQLLNKETTRKIKQTRRHRPIDIALTAHPGSPLRLQFSLSLSEQEPPLIVEIASEQSLETSLKQRCDTESLQKSMDRFGETIFYLRRFTPDFSPDAFIPKSLLNGLRQEGCALLEKKILDSYRRSPSEVPLSTNKPIKDAVEKANFPSNVAKETEDTPIQYAAVVRTLAQGLAAWKGGIRKFYLLAPPARFEANNEAVPPFLKESSEAEALPFTFSPPYLASSLADALYFEEKQIPFASDGNWNVGNLRSARFLLDHFSMLKTLYLSPELGKETVLALHHELAPLLAKRGGSLGLSVFGHPNGMFTRKTLFNRPKIELENQDGRRFWAVRNRDWFRNEENLTGSLVYFDPPNDILDEVPDLAQAGRWEFRFDFTLESPDEIAGALRRGLVSPEKKEKNGGRPYAVGYGFSHPIF